MGRVYLYGVMEGGRVPAVTPAGPWGAGPAYTIGHDGISALVSDYVGPELTALPREELVRLLLAHQLVVEKVMPGGIVLPAKVGTVLAGAGEVKALLSQGRPDFAAALKSHRGRVEVEVAATWNTGRVLQEIGLEEEVVQAREAVAASGHPTVEDRVRLGQVVKERMDRRRTGYRERMVRFLEPFFVDAVPNTLLSDELVMNVAFLVCQEQLEGFENGVQHLDRSFGGEVNFRMVGPMPPYSFGAVEVTPLCEARVSIARQTLGIGERSSEAEVRRNYRRLAAREQRAMSLGDAAARARFSELRRASDLLLAALRSAPARPPTGGEALFLIKIGRPAPEHLPHAPSPMAASRQEYVNAG